MKFQSLFSWKNKKNISLYSAKLVHRVVKAMFATKMLTYKYC